MRGNYYFFRAALLVCGCLFFTATFGASKDTVFASSLQPMGRFFRSPNGNLELISSAVHFGVRFSGTSCKIYATIPDPNAHNYLQYTLDGKYQKRIRISGMDTQPIVLSGLKNQAHVLWIYKATEAATGPIFIVKIAGSNIQSLKIPSKTLIEFIGNSITCGAAADPSEVPCGMGEYHDQHNAYLAYGPRLARALGVNFILSSVSGIGIYRNWNSLAPVMPQVYEKTDFQVNGLRNWDFNTYHPRIVSIALGTNDFSDGDHKNPRLPFDSSVFVSNYIGFVKLVRSKYPAAKIILLSSPMLNGDKREKLQNCLRAVKLNSDKASPKNSPLVLFFFKPMTPRGCGGHPNIEDHAILASELQPAFKKLLQTTN